MSERQTSLPRGVRVGVDVGGTFTDIVVSDPSGAIHAGKLASTPEDFSSGVADGVRAVLGRHAVDPAAVRDVVHGTTVATNAILERKGARTGLLTTAGFRDVLELRRLRMPRLYDLTWEKPRPLVERYLRREVAERLDAQGRSCSPLDLGAVAERPRPSWSREGVESLAVVPAPLLRQPGPRASHRRADRERVRRSCAVSLSQRRPAGDPRVRADQHDRHQRLCPAGRARRTSRSLRRAARAERDARRRC